MILQELTRLAQQRDLLQDPDYEERAVDFVLRFRRDGTYLNLEPRRNEEGKGQLQAVPRVPKRSVNICASFASDNAKYVLGIGDPKNDKPKRLKECAQAFSARLEKAAGETGDSALEAAVAFYANLNENQAAVFRDRPREEWNGSEHIALALDGDEQLLHQREAVRAHWANLRKRQQSDGTSESGGPLPRCLVTGQPCVPTRLHGSVKGLTPYGGQSSGTSLVSFNAPSFESNGYTQGDNAPVGRAAAEAYVTALNWLLGRRAGSKRPHRYGVRVGDTAVTLFWAREDQVAADAWADLWSGPEAEDVEAFYQAPFKGLEPGDLDETAFFALTVGGNASRLVVRDWIETTVGKVKASMRQYFDDLALGCNYQRPLPIWQLLLAIDPPGNARASVTRSRRDAGGPLGDLGTRIYRASVTGCGLPRELLRHALSRLRVPPDKEKNAGSKFHQRVALIKAVLCGLARRRPQLANLEVHVALDENKSDTAYVLGRLFAVIEWIQGAALGDINKTIRDRYFSAASTTPAAMFGRLLKLSIHHEAKVGAGLRHLFDERKRQIMQRLDADPLPRHLSLEHQGLFAVGYYHERDWLIEEAKRRKLEKELATAAEAAADVA